MSDRDLIELLIKWAHNPPIYMQIEDRIALFRLLRKLANSSAEVSFPRERLLPSEAA